jgi:hypothetical protein
MPERHPLRTALFIVVAIVVAVPLFPILFGFTAVLSDEFETHRTMAHIRRHQNPAELQSWATNLIAIYSSSDYAKTTGRVTNKPPAGIPISGRFPRVFVVYDRLSESYHVGFLWGSGFSPGWGMEIGDTNFVSTQERTTEWKPGIYFFRGSQ